MYPAQRRVIMDSARIVVIEAATKAGKTAGCLMWLLAKAWNDQKAGGSYWWVAPVYQQSKMAMDRVKKWLIQADPHKSHWSSHDTDLWIMLPSGCKIWFRSADDPDNLYGEDVRAAVMDEATRTKEEAFFAVRSTLTATRGQLRIIGNVRGRKNWVHQMAQRADGVEVAYHKLNCWDAVEGGILDREEVESAKRDLPDHVFRELYLAEVADDGGNPFGIPAIGRCVMPLSTDPVAAWGVDLAKSHDWTVAVGLDADYRVAEIHRWQSDWGQTKRRLIEIIGDKPALIDSTGVGDPIVEELQRSLPCVESFKFTSQSKQQIMEGLAARIQSGGIGFTDGWLRDEMESFEFEYSRNGVKYSAPSGVHDDGVCALALAVRLLGTTARNTLEVRII